MTARLPTPVVAVAYVALYVALDWVSFIHPVGVFGITPWNPPPGLSLAFLLRYGIRQGPWLFVAAIAAEFLVRGAPAPLPVLVAASLLLAVSYTALAALLTRVLRVDADLRSLRDVTVFVAAAAVACAIIALAFVALFARSGVLPPREFQEGVTQFWIGDLIGIVVTTPALLVITRRYQSWRPTLETLAELAAIGLALWLVFGAGLGEAPALFYLLFLPIVWIAMRQGFEGAVLGTVAIQLGLIVAIVVTGQGRANALEFQFLMLAIAVTGLLLGAAVSERRAIERALREKQSTLDRSLRLAAASELASTLAHELNQPLSAISAYLRACQMMLAQSGDPKGELAATMDKVIAEANRAGTVVRRLRDFFRTGSTHIEPIAPGVLIAEACATLRERAAEHHVALEQSIGDPRDVLVDRVQVESVLHNLVANAIDALKRAPGERRVRVAATKDGEGFVQIAVADNGSGVATDIEAALFDPFVTTKATGMGLGLAISRSIVEAHGGRLWHERASPGSVFAFTLPLAGSEGDAHERALGDDRPVEVER
ncbi:MAG TPA: MASE1 domain-containing protein [Casimicrobiaceae bacterium]|jgi:signal transduction histidine kinase|nr:MASE1 domain-containing protein [Casimicrobiaceae bacterium]